MPPAMITSVMPTATMPTAAFWLSRFRRFSGFRKSSPSQTALKTKSPTNAMRTPYCWSSSKNIADGDRRTAAGLVFPSPGGGAGSDGAGASVVVSSVMLLPRRSRRRVA